MNAIGYTSNKRIIAIDYILCKVSKKEKGKQRDFVIILLTGYVSEFALKSLKKLWRKQNLKFYFHISFFCRILDKIMK